jgi:hypothetical protein
MGGLLIRSALHLALERLFPAQRFLCHAVIIPFSGFLRKSASSLSPVWSSDPDSMLWQRILALWNCWNRLQSQKKPDTIRNAAAL